MISEIPVIPSTMSIVNLDVAQVTSILCLFILVFIGIMIFAPTKNKRYRQVMADMFVVGKIKQIAEEEKINLLEELKEFAKFNKMKRIDVEAIDSTIERELQEKIAKSTEPKTK